MELFGKEMISKLCDSLSDGFPVSKLRLDGPALKFYGSKVKEVKSKFIFTCYFHYSGNFHHQK